VEEKRGEAEKKFKEVKVPFYGKRRAEAPRPEKKVR